ncbi:ArsR/SmtB family transcription factor [Salinicola avicenniae]|uniref:ArsR/SmtB family transcription factor n=1 Tax=Salinicola avicenniae TaxID=2916836 RepID=UPI0020742233|nr:MULTISPECIES: metalloregulator ArsR/SmtB family transcription factor [unclassified Salinicola]
MNKVTPLSDRQLAPATAALKAVANESRLRILCLLLQGERSVTEINRELTLSQSALSQHLAVLRQENLVTTRRSSQVIFYSLNGEVAERLIQTLGELDIA